MSYVLVRVRRLNVCNNKVREKIGKYSRFDFVCVIVNFFISNFFFVNFVNFRVCRLDCEFCCLDIIFWFCYFIKWIVKFIFELWME